MSVRLSIFHSSTPYPDSFRANPGPELCCLFPRDIPFGRCSSALQENAPCCPDEAAIPPSHAGEKSGEKARPAGQQETPGRAPLGARFFVLMGKEGEEKSNQPHDINHGEIHPPSNPGRSKRRPWKTPLTQKTKLKTNSRYLMHLVQPSTPIAAARIWPRVWKGGAARLVAARSERFFPLSGTQTTKPPPLFSRYFSSLAWVADTLPLSLAPSQLAPPTGWKNGEGKKITPPPRGCGSGGRRVNSGG